MINVPFYLDSHEIAMLLDREAKAIMDHDLYKLFSGSMVLFVRNGHMAWPYCINIVVHVLSNLSLPCLRLIDSIQILLS